MLLLFMFSDGLLLSIFWKHHFHARMATSQVENSSLMGVVFGGLYELRCGFLDITVILLLIGALDEGVADNCDIDKCCILLLAKLAST